ncbi:Uncharacterised protein [Nocardia farcinica]|uniref:PI3K/PI4K catalytic domain-containing protein n=1 Tax=Nocardia farcinica TaxID=37329 RepID=A0A449G7B5_NOCFR|nr:hypothetical protein [Nocardia farcinica]VFA94733.1 Uncharacterised protein [Nocardia farcinica]
MRYREPGVQVHSLESVPDEFGGANQSWWGLATMHVKAQDGDCPFMIANELICSRLAAAMGLPVLPGEVATLDDHTKGWATPQIKHDGVTPPPLARTDQILGLYGATIAGAFVFDCWVLNEDRHISNFLFHPRLGIWLIDHEHSLGGRQGESMSSSTAQSTPLRYHAFQDVDLPQEDLNYWIRRVRHLPTMVVDLALDEAHARGLLGARTNVVSLQKLLISRRDAIESLVKASKGSTTKGAKVLPFRPASDGQLEFPPS